ncbi:hypothetical protein ACLI4U_15330 [Natrialbaceae archaeon A-CW2]|uniref:hypothetical protein n=1 Tax=Natronosalvus amylolyticus TaxID=2961994 RepID=UPI0020C9D972|nr:hypothetical protein [Natronosalvus amylolyticus]
MNTLTKFVRTVQNRLSNTDDTDEQERSRKQSRNRWYTGPEAAVPASDTWNDPAIKYQESCCRRISDPDE